MTRHRALLSSTGLAAVLIVFTPGCLSHPRVETVLYNSADGIVALKEFPDASFRAHHPVSMDPNLIRRVLAGIHVQERKTLVESTLTGEPDSVPLLTPSEVTFLTPWVTAALSQATPGELVQFHLKRSLFGRKMDINGAVYAADSTLNVSMTEYGVEPQRPGTLSHPTQSFDRAKRWSLTFMPEAALVNSDEEPQVSRDGFVPNTLVVSLEVLERYPETIVHTAPPSEGASPPSSEQMKDTLRRLKRTLEEQEQRLERLEEQVEKNPPKGR